MFPFGKNLYPLRQELRHEIERLKNILAAHGKEFVTNQGVSKTRLRKTEQKLGYQLDPDLAAFYALTDGSPARDKWFGGKSSVSCGPCEQTCRRYPTVANAYGGRLHRSKLAAAA